MSKTKKSLGYLCSLKKKLNKYEKNILCSCVCLVSLTSVTSVGNRNPNMYICNEKGLEPFSFSKDQSLPLKLNHPDSKTFLLKN